MEKIFVGIRDVNEETFRKFRSFAIEENMKIGEALNLAMKKMINDKDNKKKKLGIINIKPIDFGSGTENSSEEIDNILYKS
jgi:isoaspartyl peptidase/L-asparaginase-like protein (Ntn-hydrolase superfamily)